MEKNINLLKENTLNQAKVPLHKPKYIRAPLIRAPLIRTPLIRNNSTPITLENTKSSSISINDFELQYKIGSGSFGNVWCCIIKATGKRMAVKMIDKSLINNKKSIDMLIAEKTIMSLLDSVFITKLYYAFQGETQIYFIMELIDGGNLLSLLDSFPNGCMTEVEGRFYICELIIAVEHIHQHDISFRDLKPENILVTHSGHLKVTDFGLATSCYGKYNDLSKTTLCGTPRYMAPEMVNKSGHGKGVDIWALGCMLYEFIHGKTPFRGRMQTTFEGILLGYPVFNTSISDDARSLILKMLSKDPSKRSTCANIKKFPFFKGINWDDVKHQHIDPPRLPVISNEKNKTYRTKLMKLVQTNFEPYNSNSTDEQYIIPTIINTNNEAINLNEETLSLNKESIILKAEIMTLKEEAIALNEEAIILKEETTMLNEEAIILKEEAITLKEEAITLKEEAIVIKEEATVLKEEATVIKEEAITLKEEAIVIKEEAIVIKEEAITLKKEATVIKEEAITLKEEAITLKEEATVIKE
jgi:serine/threonine protein kinase